MAVSERLAGSTTECRRCRERVPVPLPPGSLDREQLSTWAWAGMFLGGFGVAGPLFLVGLVLDWPHQPDRSNLFLAGLVLAAGIAAGTGYLVGALAYLLRAEKPWSGDGASRGLLRGSILLGAFALVSGGIAGIALGIRQAQMLGESGTAPGQVTPDQVLLTTLGLMVCTPLVAGLVGAVLGALLGSAVGGRGGYE